jgi:hypothetical protein
MTFISFTYYPGDKGHLLNDNKLFGVETSEFGYFCHVN